MSEDSYGVPRRGKRLFVYDRFAVAIIKYDS
jgi:hypothetical protein